MHAQRGKKFLKCPSSEAIQLSPPPQNWDTRLHSHTWIFTWVLKLTLKSSWLHSKPFSNWPVSRVPVCSFEKKWNAGTWKEWPWPRSTEKSSTLITILWKEDVRQHQGPLTANSWGPDMTSHSSKSQPCNSSSMRQSEGHAQCFVRQALGVPLVFVRVKSG